MGPAGQREPGGLRPHEGNRTPFLHAWRLCGLLAVPGLAVGCAPGRTRTAAAKEPVTIFAAASLTHAFQAVGDEFAQAEPGHPVRFSFAASSALRSQIELGAAADLFASADYEQMRPLVASKLVETPRTFARNRLTLIIPKANPAGISSPQDLAKPGLRLVTTSEQVPIGRYTRTLFANLARLPGYPADYPTRVSRNFVSREPNVRSVLTKTELAEADAAVVYETDARASRRVKSIPIPGEANVVAEYPIAVVRSARNRAGAEAFARFLQSGQGQAVLQRFGFQ